MSYSHGSHAHSHVHGHGHGHPHHHDPDAPHPAQAAPWSILRMTMAGRLAGAAALSVGLWAIMWVAMQ
ncbi:hypothetical protein ACSVBT_03275 [Afipia sp. TerB]